MAIAANVKEWPRQWDRERDLRRKEWGESWPEPEWEIRPGALETMRANALNKREPVVAAQWIASRLLRIFPNPVFANVKEMFDSIGLGIRPFLYELLRLNYRFARRFEICANTHCRNAFNQEWNDQSCCDDICARRYQDHKNWMKNGKPARQRRLAERKASRMGL